MSQAQIDRLERVVGIVLRVGSRVSAVILAVGLGIALAMPASAAGPAVIRVGLLVLLSTPVARVVASVLEYASDRDWLFAGLTFIVLAVVIGSVLFAAWS